jgi:hypothetical protein
MIDIPLLFLGMLGAVLAVWRWNATSTCEFYLAPFSDDQIDEFISLLATDGLVEWRGWSAYHNELMLD